MAVEIPLGPPSKKLYRAIGGAVGIPIGLGLVTSPHGLLLGLGGGAFLTWAAGWTAFAITSWRRFATENNLALAALGRGEIAKARAIFVRWSTSRHYIASAIARHNLGWTVMLETRLDDAVAILEDAVEHHSRSLKRISLLPTTRVDIALCYALLGKIDVAETWVVKAMEPVKAAPRPSFPGTVALVRAIIACRNGRAAEAVVSLEHAFNEHEATMTGESLRVMRVMRAFACASVDGPRNQGLVERILTDMRPRYEREFAFLGVAWPEMTAFLASHELV